MDFPILQNQIVPSLDYLPIVVWIVFGLSVVIFFSISAVLLYHWVHYSLDSKKMTFVMFAYGVVGLFLILTAGAAAGYFQIIS